MHLKTLTLRGFKSFAGATTMRLEPGITCVVGPNGSGKSNVVDALAWVMGEQGAKTLRGGNMADVIFAGTSTRPALGRAQVELTIDNSDGALPIEYSEVTISRTLFRGGGSEYSINGSPARLLDIQELLSDTGMGRQMHVIVGQGQLDAILSSTPEERRGFIEEAAGVLKHRRRKDRALRKLADMDANLVRVLDLTNEIHRQLGPLARQAKAARRAHRVQAAVRDARARLLADDLVAARERLLTQGASDDALKHRLAALEEARDERRRELAAVEEADRAAAAHTEAATRAWQRATVLTERLAGTLMAAQDRVQLHSRALAAPVGEDPDELDARAEKAGAEDAEILVEVETARRSLADATQTRARSEAADEAAARELARVNRVLADHREKVARLTGDVSSAHSRLEAATAELERARALVDGAEKRRLAAEEALPDEVDLEDQSQTPASVAHREATAARDAARARVDELLAAEREARTDRAAWASRRDALAQSLTPEDATANLSGKVGVITYLPELLQVTPGMEDAVAALVAPFADAAVVESPGVVVDLLREAHASSMGRIRMVIARDAPGTAYPSHSAMVDEAAPQRPPLPHGARWALECVEVDRGVRAALEDLLGGALICEDLSQAAELLELPGIRVVATTRGDVLGHVGATGHGAATSSPLALRAHHDEAAARARAAGAREDKAKEALAGANEALDAAIRRANEALKALREEDAERARIAQERARATSAAQAAAAEAARAISILERAQDQVEWAASRVDEARERLESAGSLAPGEDLASAQAAADEAAARARAAREAETGARLALRAVEEKSRQVQAKARSLRQSAAREREERARHARREAERLSALEAATTVALTARTALDTAQTTLAEATRAREEADEARSARSAQLSALRKDIDAADQEIAELRDASHRDEIARAQMQLRLEQVEQRALEEVGLEADALVNEYGPHNLAPADLLSESDLEEEGDLVPYAREQQENNLERALRELTRLGKVNPLALEEHEALAKRHEFLVTQVQDLKKSKADLLRIVDDVDRCVEEAFASAYEDTAIHFEEVFTTLFPGGVGRMVLTDPDSMLTTGIEIEARPAGKKVKRLSLLSGGERSLAALAFLVAIFRARPSPFYVMDEVEAALDDVNLSRLIEVFRQLQETSQLIVVTHQKRTMEIADALYGVTMREGVTRVVSQRLAGG